MIYLGIALTLIAIGLTMSHYDLKRERNKRRAAIQARTKNRRYP